MELAFRGLAAFAGFLERATVLHETSVVAVAGLSARIIYAKAHKTYGDGSKLVELAQATQEERTRLGYSANDPLLRDGSLLRDQLEVGHEGMTSGVGSPEPVQAYHEYGYVNARTHTSVPPRPVLKIAMIESEPEIAELLKEVVGGGLFERPIALIP